MELLDIDTQNGVIPTRSFSARFKIGKAHDDGNCLFHSISQLLPIDKQKTHQQIRNELCQFYRGFDMNRDYPHNSFSSKLQMQMWADNEEEDGGLHQDNICRDQEWAGIMDVLALTHILKINIILFSKVRKGYTVQPYMNCPHSPNVYIKYNGTNHFEPVFLKTDIQARAIASAPSESEDSNTPNALATALDVSPETQRQIDESMAKTVSKPKPKPIPKQKTPPSALEKAPDISPTTYQEIYGNNVPKPSPKQKTPPSALEKAPDISPTTYQAIYGKNDMEKADSASPNTKQLIRMMEAETRPPESPKKQKKSLTLPSWLSIWKPKTAKKTTTKTTRPKSRSRSRSRSASPATRDRLRNIMKEDPTAPVAQRTRKAYKRLL
jgi:hypothetical protein